MKNQASSSKLNAEMREIGRFAVNAAFWLIFTLASANALLFAYSAATPLPANDSWYFLDSFVSEYYNHTLDIRDFFLKRAGDDHAQPLHRLILLWHLREFDLDFTVEAVVGVGFAMLSAIAAFFAAKIRGRDEAELSSLSSAGYWLCLAAIPVVCLSISSPQVFTWSLVTLGFILVPSSILYFLMVSAAIQRRMPVWALVPGTFVLAVLLDNLAIIYLIAAVCVCAAVAVVGKDRMQAAKTALATVAGCLLYDAVVQPLLSPDALPGASKSQGIAYILAHAQDVWKLAWYPLVSIVTPAEQLEGGGVVVSASLSLFLTASLLALHALFWMRLIKKRREPSQIDLTCAGMMIGFYGTIAAVAVARLQIDGYEYLRQPRYYVAYLLGILPIVMCGARLFAAPSKELIDRLYRAVLVPFAVVLMFAQIPMASKSWDKFKYISEYTHVAALQIGRLRDAPESTTQCADILTVCGYDTERKRKLIGILRDNQLNVFNRAFQLRHRIYLREEDAPGE